MSCTNNPKKFLFISYKGSHEPKIEKIRRYGARGWGEYEVEHECVKCEVDLGTNVMTQSELVLLGFDKKKLKEMSSFDIFAKNAEDLR